MHPLFRPGERHGGGEENDDVRCYCGLGSLNVCIKVVASRHARWRTRWTRAGHAASPPLSDGTGESQTCRAEAGPFCSLGGRKCGATAQYSRKQGFEISEDAGAGGCGAQQRRHTGAFDERVPEGTGYTR